MSDTGTDLAGMRSYLATQLGAVVGIANTYDHVPRAPVRPCLIVTPDPDEYLARGSTFGTWDALYQVLMLSSGDEQPEAVTELDQYLDAMLDAATMPKNVAVISATGAQSWAIAGGAYPGVSAQVGMVLTYCEPDPVRSTFSQED